MASVNPVHIWTSVGYDYKFTAVSYSRMHCCCLRLLRRGGIHIFHRRGSSSNSAGPPACNAALGACLATCSGTFFAPTP
ncbi:hypothetical protein BD779DRAFT_640044 [Infundibulicybe gibba]|nr:hypothetical protein BD779DRAFT_640044 [Infundibulicybe gibba]